jgi:chromate transporter
MRHPFRDVRAGFLLLLPQAAAAPAVGLAPLFFYFLKVGTVMFGSGYVLFAFLRADLVDRWHWVTNSQLLDAVAAGQVTPGPISTAATFLGYILAGPRGALLATILWLISTALFGAYVRYVGRYNLLYGSVGAGLALVSVVSGCTWNRF